MVSSTDQFCYSSLDTHSQISLFMNCNLQTKQKLKLLKSDCIFETNVLYYE